MDVIDLNKPDQVKDFVKWKGRMYDFELSTDGKWVAGSTDVGTHLWRADTLELVTTFPVITADHKAVLPKADGIEDPIHRLMAATSAVASRLNRIL